MGKKEVGPHKSSLLDQLHGRQGDTTRRELDNTPIVNGKLTDEVVSAVGAGEIISHKLGKVPKGWIVVSLAADAAITTPLREYAAANKDSIFVSNDSSVEVTYRLWVFS
jgi:hypothetical protein